MGEEEKKEIFSIVTNLFFGQVDEDQVFPFPSFSDEQKEMGREMCSAIEKYCLDNIDTTKMDEEASIPDEVFEGFKELGLFGLGIEEEHGGMNLDYTLYSRTFAQVAAFDGSLATMLGAHQSIGYKALHLYGNDEQKKNWLPKLASGEVIAAFCLTEPSSGSDAYSIKTKAVKDKDGNYIINGQKLWITNGGLAGFYTVFCKTEHEQDGNTVEKISCFIVEKEREGVSFGAKENKMGIRASETRAVYFDNVKIPASNIIGEEGKGFKIAMNVLNSGRLSLGAGCVGGMKSVLELATKQAANRKIYSSESVVYFTTGLMDRGLKDYHLESAICKVFNSEALWEVVDMALQIAAGSGYMKEYPFERIMRDSRINLIFEGTNEILRAFIALSGMRGPSVNLKELGKMADVPTALKDPIKSLGVLTDFAVGRISKFIGPSSITKCHPELSRFADRVPNMVSSFSIHVENTLMKYGKKIVDHEMPLKRISNMVTDIYATLATLSRTTSILESEKIDEETKKYVLRLNDLACGMLYKDFKVNSREMDKNKDKVIKEITENVVKNEGYGLDIIDF